MKPVILAVICKDELDYIEEFVYYHLNLGFDKIIIGDNNDKNTPLYQSVLDYYIRKKQVSVVNLRGKKAVQKEFYNAIIKGKFDYEWCAFIDTDEFLTFNPKSGFTNIKDFLNSKPDIKAYKVNWMLFGDNGKARYEDEDMIVRFPEPMPRDFKFHYPFSDNYHCKSILHRDVKAKFVDSPHTVGYEEYYSPSGKELKNSSPFNPDIEWDVLYIRHYYTKTIEEWVKHKFKKGYADLPTPQRNTYRLDDFFIYNEKTDEKLKVIEEYGIEYQ